MSERLKNVAALLVRPRCFRTLFREAKRDFGYTEQEVRIAVMELDCKVTRTLRIKLPTPSGPTTEQK